MERKHSDAEIDLSDSVQTSFNDLFEQYTDWRDSQGYDQDHKDLVDEIFTPLLDELHLMVQLLCKSSQ